MPQISPVIPTLTKKIVLFKDLFKKDRIVQRSMDVSGPPGSNQMDNPEKTDTEKTDGEPQTENRVPGIKIIGKNDDDGQQNIKQHSRRRSRLEIVDDALAEPVRVFDAHGANALQFCSGAEGLRQKKNRSICFSPSDWGASSSFDRNTF